VRRALKRVNDPTLACAIPARLGNTCLGRGGLEQERTRGTDDPKVGVRVRVVEVRMHLDLEP
jgi:hypothetical protein